MKILTNEKFELNAHDNHENIKVLLRNTEILSIQSLGTSSYEYWKSGLILSNHTFMIIQRLKKLFLISKMQVKLIADLN